MQRIERLPEAVANQIAAGEVVERPASCVKELVENALDAGATRVEVELAGGGVELIRVADDGHGMGPEDAVLALERHATSKLRRAEDLATVATLGFRGEALPSIASVSRFTLTTQPWEADEGTRVSVTGGAAPEVQAIGAAPGTSVEVRDLFFNVPARRKFLKTAQTEVGHVQEVLVRLAIVRPDVTFVLRSEGRIALEVPRSESGDPRGRLGRILGAAVAEHLFPIGEAGGGEGGPRGSVEVRGFAGSPELTERTPRSLYTFVNRRFVRDRTIHHAIQDAYRTLLERGRHPVVILELAIDPSRVDVNVHPQKSEVRFEDSGAIHRAVSGALGRTLARQPWLGAGPPEPPAARTYVLGGRGQGDGEPAPSRVADAAPGRGSPRAWAPATGPGGAKPPVRLPWEPEAEGWRGQAGGSRALDAVPAAPPRVPVDAGPPPSAAPPQLVTPGLGGRFGALEPVGQVMATYLVCQGPGRMVIIDQHAAHERIAFERMKRQHAEKEVARQPLLLPLAVELDPRRAAAAESARAELSAIGLELEPFGGRTWLVKSRPAALGAADLEELVLDVLDELTEVGETTPARERLEALLSSCACHTVVRAGDRLTGPEISALLRDMDEIDFGAHCPHGRPVFVEWSEKALAALFHRT